MDFAVEAEGETRIAEDAIANDANNAFLLDMAIILVLRSSSLHSSTFVMSTRGLDFCIDE
jgi:hypothetical protein